MLQSVHGCEERFKKPGKPCGKNCILMRKYALTPKGLERSASIARARLTLREEGYLDNEFSLTKTGLERGLELEKAQSGFDEESEIEEVYHEDDTE